MFLQKEFDKYNSWNELMKGSTAFHNIIDDAKSYSNVKTRGIGYDTLKKFMGSNWKEWVIKEGLRNTQKTQKKVVKKLPRIAQNGRKSPS